MSTISLTVAQKALFGDKPTDQRTRDWALHQLMDAVSAGSKEASAAWRLLTRANDDRLFGGGAYRRFLQMMREHAEARRGRRALKAARNAQNRRERGMRDKARQSSR